MRSHGSGRACYYGQRPPEGSCEACKKVRADYNRWYRTTPTGDAVSKEATARYLRTAKGMLANIRGAAQQRGRR